MSLAGWWLRRCLIVHPALFEMMILIPVGPTVQAHFDGASFPSPLLAAVDECKDKKEHANLAANNLSFLKHVPII
jgi:hypothetical protein